MVVDRMNDAEEITRYYSEDPMREWGRLDQDLYHRIEFEVVHRIVKEHVTTGSRVLELGSGPGRRALRLAEEGVDVALQDLSSALLDLAVAQFDARGLLSHLISVHLGDASKFVREGKPFDVCLVAGPVYHANSSAEAVRALAAARRAVVPGGVVVCVFVTQISVLKDLVKSGRADLATKLVETGFLEHGHYRRPIGEAADFYMPQVLTHRLAEARSLLVDAGLKPMSATSCEGPAAWLRPYVAQVGSWDGNDPLATLADLALACRDDRAVVEGGDHFAVVARAPLAGSG